MYKYYHQDYQIKLKNFFNAYTVFDSILLFHSVGTGKTCASLFAASYGFKGKRIVVLVKNDNIKRNFVDEVYSKCLDWKLEDDATDNKKTREINKVFDFYHYTEFSNAAKGMKILPKEFTDCVFIIDEVHNITMNENYATIYNFLKKIPNLKLMLLSATPITDDITEIFYISNLLNASNYNNQIDISSIETNGYVTNFTQKSTKFKANLKILTQKGKEKLAQVLENKISIVKQNKTDFPSVSVEIISIPFENVQLQEYNEAFERENNERKSFYIESTKRSIASKDNNVSNKLKRLLDDLESDTGNVFIYCSFVKESGSEMIKSFLLKNGYTRYPNTTSNNNGKTFMLYTENVPFAKRELHRKIFNNETNKNGEKIRIIIGSPIISEGINLMNVRNVYVIDPPWNPAKLDQIVGRAVRHKSHALLPDDQKNVTVKLYSSVSDGIFDIDIEKYKLINDKRKCITDAEGLLASIKINFENTKTTEFLSKIHPELINSQDIPYSLNVIKLLFAEHYYYTFNDISSFLKKYNSNVTDELIIYLLNYIVTEFILIKDKFGKERILLVSGDTFYLDGYNTGLYDYYNSTATHNTKIKYIREFIKIETTQPKKQKQTDKPIDDETRKYNEAIENKYPLFGSYRSRGSLNDKYSGVIDGTFRIIDNRYQKLKTGDARLINYGMAATSYKKPVLQDIARFLKLENSMTPKEFNRMTTLIQKIEEFLVNNEMMLR